MAQLRATVTAAALPQKSCRSAQAARSWICAGRAVGAHSTSSSLLDASSAPGAAAAEPLQPSPTRACHRACGRSRRRKAPAAEPATAGRATRRVPHVRRWDRALPRRGRLQGARSHECLLRTRGGVGSQACALYRSMRDRAASRWYMWQIRERCDARAACGCVEWGGKLCNSSFPLLEEPSTQNNK